MASGFSEVPAGIAYQESLSPVVRGFVLFMGLCMFVIPVPFLMHARWSALSFTTLVAALFVVAPVGIGCVFFTMALAGTKRILFDAQARVLHMVRRGPLGRRVDAIPFSAIEEWVVERRQAVDDPDYFLLRLRIAGRRRPYWLGVFGREDEAALWQGRVDALLRGPVASSPPELPP